MDKVGERTQEETELATCWIYWGTSRFHTNITGLIRFDNGYSIASFRSESSGRCPCFDGTSLVIHRSEYE
jgi:hypothetical protein